MAELTDQATPEGQAVFGALHKVPRDVYCTPLVFITAAAVGVVFGALHVRTR